MNPDMGIESLVANKADMYAGQPQALAQLFQNNQQLVDLLALQKLKSEKDAAARQMQLEAARQMGQAPTIMDQREQELMQRSKDEVLQQVGGAFQHEAAQEKQALQNLLRGGIAAGLPPQQFASGGIVAFAEGGAVDEEMDEEDEIQREIEALMEERRNRVRNAPKGEEAEAQMYDELYASDPWRRGGIGPAIRDWWTGRSAVEDEVRSRRAQQNAPAMAEPEVATEVTETAAPVPGGEEMSANIFASIAPGIGAPDETNRFQDQMEELLGMIKSQITPDEGAYDTGAQRFRDAMGGVDPALREEYRTSIDKLGKGPSDEELKRDRLAAWLLGAGGSSSLGQALRSGGVNAMNVRGDQRRAQEDRDKQRLEGIQSLLNMDRADALGAFQAGTTQESQAHNRATVALQNYTSTLNHLSDAEVERANRANQRLIKQAEMENRMLIEGLKKNSANPSQVLQSSKALLDYYNTAIDKLMDPMATATLSPQEMAARQLEVEELKAKAAEQEAILSGLSGATGGILSGGAPSGGISPDQISIRSVRPAQ